MSSHLPVFQAYEWASGPTCLKPDARLNYSSCARARQLVQIQEESDCDARLGAPATESRSTRL